MFYNILLTVIYVSYRNRSDFYNNNNDATTTAAAAAVIIFETLPVHGKFIAAALPEWEEERRMKK